MVTAVLPFADRKSLILRSGFESFRGKNLYNIIFTYYYFLFFLYHVHREDITTIFYSCVLLLVFSISLSLDHDIS